MNRITNALAAAIPSSSSASDASSIPPAAPSIGSPDLSTATTSGRPSLAPGIDGPPGWAAGAGVSGFASAGSSGYERANFQSLIYDDPRQIHFYTGQDRMVMAPGLAFGRDRSGSRRPPHLRHVSDNPATAMASGSRSGAATPVMRLKEDRDRSVRADLGGKKGQNRLSGLVKGTDGRYAIGGPQCLRIIHLSSPSSGTSSPTSSSPNRGRISGAMLARGAGGVRVTEVANLWKTSWSISKGVNDLDWGSGAFNNKLVTATPSGGFLIFDVNKGRLDREIHGGSPRPLNRVHLCPHPTYGHLLLTGSAEGQAKLWDLRENNPHQKKYYKHSTAVTALAFSPDEPQSLVVGTENGTLKRYDLRMAPKPVGTLWGAHGNKPVMDLEWKAALPGDDGGFMASAGADKVVQIWDMAQQWDRNPAPLHTLHTALPPRRVAWRPDQPTELAVVPLQQALIGENDADAESTIEVWDVRRHHIAKYALPAGKISASGSGESTPVDAVWGEDSMGLVTAFSAGVIAQLDMRSRTLPLEGLPRQTVAWSSRGEVAYAVDRFKSGEIPFDDLKPEYASNWDKVGRRPKGVADPPYQPLQAVGIVPMPEVDEIDFRFLAEFYRVEGGPAVALCLHNQAIAMRVDRIDDARLWGFLARLLVELGPMSEDGFRMATFDEDIFSHPLDQAPQIPDPPSPSGSPRGSSTQLPTPSDSRAMSPVTRSKKRYVSAGIALDRVKSPLDPDQVEKLASATSSPRYSTAGFASFKPIDNADRRLSDPRASVATIRPAKDRSRESTATIVAPRFSRHFSGGKNRVVGDIREEQLTSSSRVFNASGPQSANRSLSTSPVHVSGNDLRRGSLASSPTRSRTGSYSRERHNSHGESTSQSFRDRKISDKSSSGKCSNAGMHDYPDPYGFIPSLGAVTGSSSRTATETSTSSRNPTRDPSPAPAKMHAGSLSASLGRAAPSAIATAAAAAMAPGGSMRMSSAKVDTTNSSRTGSGDKGNATSTVNGNGGVPFSSSPRSNRTMEPGSVKKGSGLAAASGGSGAVTETAKSSSRPSRSSGPTTATARTSSDTRTSVGGPRDARMSKHNGHGWMTTKAWDDYRSARCSVFMDWWTGLIDEGNVQLAVTVMVIATGIVDFPQKQSERLAHAYIDILDRYRLPVQSAYMRKYAAIISLQITSTQIGVTHLVHCQRCGRSTGSLEDIGMEKQGKKFWFCGKCKSAAKACIICRQPVRGLYVACAKCKHGGHSRCMNEYFATRAGSQVQNIPRQGSSPGLHIGNQSGLHRTSSIPFAGIGSALNSGIVREAADQEGTGSGEQTPNAGGHSGQRAIHTPGHSGFAQLSSIAAVTGSSAGAGNPSASSHDSSSFAAPPPSGRAAHNAHSNDMQAIASGLQMDEYSDRLAGSGVAEAGEGAVQYEVVRVKATTKCPQGCGCVCRVVTALQEVAVNV